MLAGARRIHLLKNIFQFSLVGFKGNLSVPEIHGFLSSRLEQMERRQHQTKGSTPATVEKPRGTYASQLGPLAIGANFLTVFFWGEGCPTKIDYRKKDTLILTSLLEDLVKSSLPSCSYPRINT